MNSNVRRQLWSEWLKTGPVEWLTSFENNTRMRCSVTDTPGICLAPDGDAGPAILANHRFSYPRRRKWADRRRTCSSSLSLGTKAKKCSDELNEIVLAARHERDALGALFEQLDGRSGKLAEVSTTVEHVKDRAIDASEQLTAIVARITDLDKRRCRLRVDWSAGCRNDGHRAAGPGSGRAHVRVGGRAAEAPRGDGAARRRISRDPGCNRSAGRPAPAGDRRARRAAAVSGGSARAIDQAAGIRQRARSASRPGVVAGERSSCPQQDRGTGVGKHRRRHAHGQGSRVEDRIPRDAPRARVDDRGTAQVSECTGRARHGQDEGARHPAGNHRPRRIRGQPG